MPKPGRLTLLDAVAAVAVCVTTLTLLVHNDLRRLGKLSVTGRIASLEKRSLYDEGTILARVLGLDPGPDFRPVLVPIRPPTPAVAAWFHFGRTAVRDRGPIAPGGAAPAGDHRGD